MEENNQSTPPPAPDPNPAQPPPASEPNSAQPPPPPIPPPQPASSSKDERMWAMFCHLSMLCGYVIPFGNIIGPLVIWMIKRDEYPLVADQGKESLNFQITVMLAVLICIPLIFVCGIGAFLAMGVGIAALVFVVIAAIKANEGVKYRYPATLRLIK